MGSIGLQEMVFIFVVALLIFGPKKLPELGRSLGKGLSEFRRASSELRSSFEREMENIERETRVEEDKKTATAVADSSSTAPTDSSSTAPTDSYSYSESDPYSSDYGYDYAGYSGEQQEQPSTEPSTGEPQKEGEHVGAAEKNGALTGEHKD